MKPASRRRITTLDWHGHRLELRIAFSPRFLMFATDTMLYVDGRRIARKGGLGITETAAGRFLHDGRQIRAELQVCGGPRVLTAIPYFLRLDGRTVGAGRLRLERLAPAIAVWLALAGLLILLAGAL